MIFKNLSNNLKQKTPEQTVTFYLFWCFLLLNVICIIARIFNLMWFKLDFENIPDFTNLEKELICSVLLFIELYFVFKTIFMNDIKNWKILIICLIDIIFCAISPYTILDNLIMLVFYLVIPFIFTKDWRIIFRSIIIYCIGLIYSIVVSTCRLYDLGVNSNNFLYNLLSIIDYKLFFIVLYLFNKNWGLNIWKKLKLLK